MKKEYKKPELEEIKIKHRTSLLESSEPKITGEVGYNASPVEEPKA